jgi:hypothetical protein
VAARELRFPSTGATARVVGGRGMWWDRRWLTLVLDDTKEEGTGRPALFSRPPAVSCCRLQQLLLLNLLQEAFPVTGADGLRTYVLPPYPD